MKKIALIVLSLGLFISGCSIGSNEEKDNKKSNGQTVLSTYSISENHYKTGTSFEAGAARGLVNRLNTRLDIDEFETGLMRIATESFSTEDYYFQSGSFLDKDTINMLVKRKRVEEEVSEEKGDKKKDKTKPPNIGLNPPLPEGPPETLEKRNAKAPLYLANILEHNYYVAKDNNEKELGGVVIGLAMNSVHYYEEQHGYPREVQISDEVLLKQGKEMAQKILPILQEKDPQLRDVPIVFAIYRQEGKGSLVPGSFLAYTQVDKGDGQVEDWKHIDEEYYLFPSAEADEAYREDATIVKNFNAKLADYFKDDYTAVIGKGFYQDGQLKEMKLEIPVKFSGKSDIIAFTQFVGGNVMHYFPNYVKVQVTIKSINRPEAIIIRDVKQDEPLMKILN